MRLLLEMVFHAVYLVYRVSFALYRAADLVWSTVVLAVTYTVGFCVDVVFILAVECLTLYGAAWLYRAENLIGAFFAFAAGQTLVIVSTFHLVRALLTYRFKHVLGSDQYRAKRLGYTPVVEEPEDPPDPLFF